MNEGRASKYLLYAIGEIFLVVIGILIALQVNNWNEVRKEARQEVIYLNQLRSEFKSDSINLRRSSFLVNWKVKQADTLLHMIEGQPLGIDTLSFIRNAFLIGRSVIFMPYLPTYEELISSGQINLISNKKLSDLIRAYINRMEGLNRFSFMEGEKRKETYNTHLYNYCSAEIMPVFWKTEMVREGKDFMKKIALMEMDISGFIRDPNSRIQVQNTKATDMELSFLYTQTMERHIIPIIEMIEDELDNN